MKENNDCRERLIQRFSGQHTEVLGLGISNLPLIDVLLAAGAKVTARDKAAREKFGEEKAKMLEEKGVSLVFGENYLDNLKGDTVFRSPGLHPHLPQLEKVRSEGKTVTSEMELFLELCPSHTIGITGSNGKTTTTTLTYRFLTENGHRAFLGGNIGSPLLPRVFEMTPEDFAVLELSSFQLFEMKHSTEIALITNLSPNHLDYHRDMEEYIGAKKAIYRNSENKLLVLNAGDPITASLAKEAQGDVHFFNGQEGENAVYEKDGVIFCRGREVMPTSSILLRGRHNVENYMAAIAATDGFADDKKIRKVAETFTGVEHRLEFVREKNGVKYYNGSIDSSPSRTAAALSAFDERIVVIAGGYDKHIPYAPLGKPLCDKARVLILCGATAPKIKEAVLACPDYSPEKTKIIEEPDLRAATLRASAEALPGESVLLSPASASFDAFKNFEERGRFYKDIVNALR